MMDEKKKNQGLDGEKLNLTSIKEMDSKEILESQRVEYFKFLKQGYKFLLVVILVLLVFSTYYNQGLIKNKVTYLQDESYVESRSEDFDFLFLGDSHIADNVNPLYVNDSFNMGMSGSNYVEDYFRLRRVINDGVNLTAVIINIDPQSFSSSMTNNFAIKEPRLFSKFMSYGELGAINNQSRLKVWIESKIPFVGNGWEIIQYVILNPESAHIFKGYPTKSERNVDPAKDAEVKFNVYFSTQKRITNISMTYFIKTLKLVKENNISIFLITVPHSKAYNNVLIREHVDIAGYYETVFSEINSSVNNYVYENYFSLYFNRSDLFDDADHLSREGAKEFSLLLNDDIKTVYSGLTKNNSVSHKVTDVSEILLENSPTSFWFSSRPS